MSGQQNSGALGQLFDGYSRQARLAPALLVIFPVIILIAVWLPSTYALLAGFVSVAIACGLVFFIAQLARDRGKRLEPTLFSEWGGKPSVVLLRHADNRIDPLTKRRFRTFLETRLGVRLASEQEEAADPAKADQSYEAATAWLLGQTRDQAKFSLLFRENVSYGFRRNLWGLKPIGVAAAGLGATASTAVLLAQYFRMHRSPSPEVLVVTSLVWLMLAVWILVVRRPWVKLAADAYAIQLLAACDRLS